MENGEGGENKITIPTEDDYSCKNVGNDGQAGIERSKSDGSTI